MYVERNLFDPTRMPQSCDHYRRTPLEAHSECLCRILQPKPHALRLRRSADYIIVMKDEQHNLLTLGYTHSIFELTITNTLAVFNAISV